MSVWAPATIVAVEKRRVALLRVSPETWLGLMQTLGERRITQQGLPQSAKVIGTGYDFETRTIVLTLEDESFDEVAMYQGVRLAYLDVMLTDHGPWPLDVPDSA